MKNLHYIAAALLLMFSTAVIAHHPAEGVVDDEVYDMIDSMVADTPHADVTFDDTMDVNDDGVLDNVTTITAPTIVSLDRMLDDGLLDYVNMLDGDVTLIIEFSDVRTVDVIIVQSP